MELNFDTEDAKQAFVARIDRAKRSLAATARGSLPLDSRELISVLLDKLEQEQEQAGAVPEREHLQSDKSKVFPMLENSGLCVSIALISLYKDVNSCSGIFTGNTDASDEQLFVCELKTCSVFSLAYPKHVTSANLIVVGRPIFARYFTQIVTKRHPVSVKGTSPRR